MSKTTLAQVRKKAKAIHKTLVNYRVQLEARHKAEPLKPPPLFLLNWATDEIERLSQLK